MILRDDGHRISKLDENFETGARQPQVFLDGLVGIRDSAHGDDLRTPLSRTQLIPKQLGRLFLDQDATLEIQARGKSKILMGRAGITVHATVLTAAIGVNTRTKTDIRTVIVSNDFSGNITQQYGLWCRLTIQRVIRNEVDPLESILWVMSNATATDTRLETGI